MVSQDFSLSHGRCPVSSGLVYLGLLAFAAVSTKERECQKLARLFATLLKHKLADKSWLVYGDHARFMLVMHVLAPRKTMAKSALISCFVRTVISRIFRIAKMVLNPYQTIRKAIVVSVNDIFFLHSCDHSETDSGVPFSQENAQPMQRVLHFQASDVCESG
jgi:hypothetical protein